ncbi:MAG: potassium channel family protein [Actinomycetota bacterium]
MSPTEQRSNGTSQQADVGRFAFLLVIVALIIGLLGLIGSPPLSDDARPVVRMLLTVLAGGVLFATLRITQVSHKHQRWFGTVIGALVFTAIVGFLFTSHPIFEKTISFMWVLLVLAAPALVLRQVLASDRVTIQTILGAITVYLLIGVSLTFLAIAMEESIGFFEVPPRSTAFVYFAFVTITTLGYGDLSPYTDAARMVSVLAAVTAQMYLVIVVARLVGIWSPSSNQIDPGDE